MPSPNTAASLKAAGYEELHEGDVWRVIPGQKVYVIRGGSIAAFHMGQRSPVDAGFRLIGAHTDSPNLRIKPNPQVKSAGCTYNSASSLTAVCSCIPGSIETCR